MLATLRLHLLAQLGKKRLHTPQKGWSGRAPPTLLQRQVDRSPRPGKTQPEPGRLAAGGAQLRVKAAGAAALAPPLGRPAPRTPRLSDARKPSGLGCLSRSSVTSGPERPVHCGTPEPNVEAALTPGGRVQKATPG